MTMNGIWPLHQYPSALARMLVGFIVLFAALASGSVFVHAGWEKLDHPAWTGAQAGAAMSGFITGANAKSIKSERNPHPDVLPVLRTFNERVATRHVELFSWMVVLGELLVPIGVVALLCVRFPGSRTLLLGLAGLAASMNLLYLHQGSSGVNPPMLLMWLTVLWLVALLPSAALAYAIDLRPVRGGTSEVRPAVHGTVGAVLFFGIVLAAIVAESAFMTSATTTLALAIASVALAGALVVGRRLIGVGSRGRERRVQRDGGLLPA
jgi:thiosulfate dehydrogenase [quinone] large subunit